MQNRTKKIICSLLLLGAATSTVCGCSAQQGAAAQRESPQIEDGISGSPSSKTERSPDASDSAEEPLESTAKPQEHALSKEDIIAIFADEDKNKNCIVTDCVIAKDLAYGLTDVY